MDFRCAQSTKPPRVTAGCFPRLPQGRLPSLVNMPELGPLRWTSRRMARSIHSVNHSHAALRISSKTLTIEGITLLDGRTSLPDNCPSLGGCTSRAEVAVAPDDVTGRSSRRWRQALNFATDRFGVLCGCRYFPCYFTALRRWHRLSTRNNHNLNNVNRYIG